MAEHTLRGKVAVVGIGETTYYKHSQSPDPEFVLIVLRRVRRRREAHRWRPGPDSCRS